MARVESAKAWAMQEFGGAQLGDRRRTRRLVAMATEASQRPSGRVSEVFRHVQGQQGAYDLLENPKVRAEAVFAAAQRACVRRARGLPYVVVPVDGTSLALTDRRSAKDFGPIGTHQRGARGLKVIDALALTPDGTPLGLAGMKWWARARRRRKPSRNRAPRERESHHGSEVVVEVARALERDAPSTKAWFQLDREGDAQGTLTELMATGHWFTVRSNGHRRLSVQGERTYLRPFILRQPPVGYTYVHVPGAPGRSARRARMVVRVCAVTLDLHNHWTKTHTSLAITGVHVHEADAPPHGEKPLDWMLLTNWPVATLQDALHVVRGYCLRWRIEDFHRTWKSGRCQVEDTQLRTRAGVITWATLLAAVAVRIERLKHLARNEPEKPASVELTPSELQALILLKRRNKSRHEVIADTMPSIAQATRWIADLGGYTGKSSGGPPGSVVIGRGLEDVRIAALVIEALEAAGKLKKLR